MGCQSSSQRQISNGAVDAEFVTVTLKQGNVATAVDRDILVQFKRPHKFFLLAAISATFANSNVFLHFWPLGYNPVIGVTTIAPGGGEQWIPLSLIANNPGRCEGRWIRFTKPITQFFIDADHNGVTSANPYLITFVGTDDIEDIISERS